jgi:uncharacterized membrane protein
MEVFSDGVFAIAITLLVLEISVPVGRDEHELWHELGKEWPYYFGYALSFISIGIMWMNHHEFFRDIKRVDQPLLGLNLLLLMCVAFLPFPTAVLATQLDNASGRLPATLLYGGTLTVTAVMFNILWLYASAGNRLIDRHVSDARLLLRTRRYVLGPVSYGLTLPLALISPWISLAIYVGLSILYLLPLNE